METESPVNSKTGMWKSFLRFMESSVGMNRTALGGLYLSHRNSCHEFDMKQLTVSFVVSK